MFSRTCQHPALRTVIKRPDGRAGAALFSASNEADAPQANEGQGKCICDASLASACFPPSER